MNYLFVKGIKPAMIPRYKKIKLESEEDIIRMSFMIKGDFNDPEVQDIKKMVGIKPRFFNSHTNSVMVGICKNRENKLQCCFYTHDQDGTARFPYRDPYYVYADIKFNIYYDAYLGVDESIGQCWGKIVERGSGETVIGHALKHNISKRYYLINPWYGGTYPPDNCFRVEADVSIV